MEDVVERLRKLNACDPECEGRCKICPDEIAREAADLITRLRSGAYAAALEDAARVADQVAVEEMVLVDHYGSADYEDFEQRDSAGSRAYAARTIAAAIRALSPSPSPEKGLGVPSDRDAPSDEHSALVGMAIIAHCTELRELAADVRQENAASNSSRVADELDRQANYLGAEINGVLRHYKLLLQRATGGEPRGEANTSSSSTAAPRLSR